MVGRRKNDGENAGHESNQPFGGAPQRNQPPYQGQSQGSGYPPPQSGGQQGQPPQQPLYGPPTGGMPYGQQPPYGPPTGGTPYNQQPPAKKNGGLAKKGCLGCGGLLVLIVIIVAIVAGVRSSSSTSDDSSASAADQATSSAPSSPESSAAVSSGAKANGSEDSSSKMDEAYGKFTPISKSGTSAAVISLPSSAKAGIITATYSGSSNFIISGLDSDNKPTADIGLPNAIGHYSGTTMFGAVDLGNKATRLKVEATGPWKVTISPVSDAPKFPTAGASGTGDAVYLYTGDATTMNVSYKGSSNFIVGQVGEAFSGAQINEIGNYSGQSAFVGGTQPLTINADGSWTIKPSR